MKLIVVLVLSLHILTTHGQECSTQMKINVLFDSTSAVSSAIFKKQISLVEELSLLFKGNRLTLSARVYYHDELCENINNNFQKEEGFLEERTKGKIKNALNKLKYFNGPISYNKECANKLLNNLVQSGESDTFIVSIATFKSLTSDGAVLQVTGDAKPEDLVIFLNKFKSNTNPSIHLLPNIDEGKMGDIKNGIMAFLCPSDFKGTTSAPVSITPTSPDDLLVTNVTDQTTTANTKTVNGVSDNTPVTTVVKTVSQSISTVTISKVTILPPITLPPVTVLPPITLPPPITLTPVTVTPITLPPIPLTPHTLPPIPLTPHTLPPIPLTPNTRRPTPLTPHTLPPIPLTPNTLTPHTLPQNVSTKPVSSSPTVTVNKTSSTTVTNTNNPVTGVTTLEVKTATIITPITKTRPSLPTNTRPTRSNASSNTKTPRTVQTRTDVTKSNATVVTLVTDPTSVTKPINTTTTTGEVTIVTRKTRTTHGNRTMPIKITANTEVTGVTLITRPTKPTTTSLETKTFNSNKPTLNTRPSKTTRVKTTKSKLVQEILSFKQQNITTKQLKNKTWSIGFIKQSSDVIGKISAPTEIKDTKDEEKEKLDVIKYVETVLVQIANNLEVGTSISVQKNGFIAEMEAVDPKNFTGFTFPKTSSNQSNSNGKLTLPKGLLKNNNNDKISITAMKFNTLSLMKTKEAAFRPFDDILSVTLDPPIEGVFEEPLTYTMLSPKEDIKKFKCVFWNESMELWDSSGCNVSRINGSIVSCNCYHMTSFSVLMQLADFETNESHAFILSIITYVGCGISIIGCILLILTFAVVKRTLKNDRNKIHVNLALSLAIANGLFLTIDHFVDRKNVCLGLSIATLYFYLSTFFWMLVEGIHVFLMMRKVFHQPKSMPLYYLIGWLIPVPIVTITTVMNRDYMTRDDICWISTENGVMWAFVGPVLFVIVVNTFILLLTLYTSRNIKSWQEDESELYRITKLTLILIPIFGISWVFGVFSVNQDTLTFQYIFTVINILQGFFIFIGYCFFNNDLKREFSKSFKKSTSGTSSKSGKSKSKYKQQELSIYNGVNFGVNHGYENSPTIVNEKLRADSVITNDRYSIDSVSTTPLDSYLGSSVPISPNTRANFINIHEV